MAEAAKYSASATGRRRVPDGGEDTQLRWESGDGGGGRRRGGGRTTATNGKNREKKKNDIRGKTATLSDPRSNDSKRHRRGTLLFVCFVRTLLYFVLSLYIARLRARRRASTYPIAEGNLRAPAQEFGAINKGRKLIHSEVYRRLSKEYYRP